MQKRLKNDIEVTNAIAGGIAGMSETINLDSRYDHA